MISFNDLIIYFDNDLPPEIVLQIKFRCNSIVIPIYNYLFNLVSSHSNYKLSVYIKSLGSQCGEIKNTTSFSCIPCDSDLGLFSQNLNSEKCELEDDISKINVQSAFLNLKYGYWRRYFQSNSVSYCLNLPQICLGDWEEGDNSCFIGQIGALCEQCDLYSTKGEREFSVSQKYSCGSCLVKEQNALIIIAVSIRYQYQQYIGTLISILISVQSILKTIEKFVRIISIMKLGLAVTSKIFKKNEYLYKYKFQLIKQKLILQLNRIITSII